MGFRVCYLAVEDPLMEGRLSGGVSPPRHPSKEGLQAQTQKSRTDMRWLRLPCTEIEVASFLNDSP